MCETKPEPSAVEVHVVCGWNDDYMDVIGVFTDEHVAYQVEALKSEEYQETRVIDGTLDDIDLLRL